MWLMYDEGDSADNLECWGLVVHPNLVFGVGRTTFISSYFVVFRQQRGTERGRGGMASGSEKEDSRLNQFIKCRAAFVTGVMV